MVSLTFEFFDQVWSLSEQSQRAALVENLLNLFISGHMVVSKNGPKKHQIVLKKIEKWS